MKLKLLTLRTIVLLLSPVITVCAMDNDPEPIALDEHVLANNEPQSVSDLLALLDEQQQGILQQIEAPTFTEEDWARPDDEVNQIECITPIDWCLYNQVFVGSDYSPRRLVEAIIQKFEEIEQAIEKALPAGLYDRNQLHGVQIMPQDKKQLIIKQYIVEMIAQALREALNRHKLSLCDIIDHKVEYGSETLLVCATGSIDATQVLLRASDDPCKLVFQKNKIERTILHYSVMDRLEKEQIIMYLEAAGPKVRELINTRCNWKSCCTAGELAQNHHPAYFKAVQYVLEKNKDTLEDSSGQCTIS